ncbi:MAG: GspE/PulE family protein [Porticoccaceae bacterium]
MTEQKLRSVDDLKTLKPLKPALTESQLGAQFVSSGIINTAELKEIIQKKLQTGKTFLEAMEMLGYAHDANQPAILASRLAIPLVSVATMEIPEDVVRMIPGELLAKYQCFPLGFANGKLIVAMANPCNVEAIQTISFASEHVIEIVMASKHDINILIERYLLSSEEDDILSEINASLLREIPSKELSTQALQETAQQQPVVKFVDSLLRRAVALKASDINIRPTDKGADVYYRIDGKMIFQRNLNIRQLAPIVCRIKIISGMNIAERRLPQDGHTMLEENNLRIDFRVSVIPMVTGESVVIRILDKNQGLVSLDALGLPVREIARMRNILSHSYGIFLVTGPTGSGKTTTLYAVVNERRTKDPHIITVEDPVEYRLDGVEQIQIKPKIGYTFAEALRHILRHDPDEILIGEMRDYETAEIAVKASLTGHFVMSTLHTNDAPSSITRLVDMGIETYLINSSLVGVLAQRLVRKLCLNCKQPDPDKAGFRAFFQLPDTFEAYIGAGCIDCHNTGYRGRLMVGELLEMTSALKELISQKANADTLRIQAMKDGMSSLTENALQLVKEGKTSLEEVFRVRQE